MLQEPLFSSALCLSQSWNFVVTVQLKISSQHLSTALNHYVCWVVLFPSGFGKYKRGKHGNLTVLLFLLLEQIENKVFTGRQQTDRMLVLFHLQTPCLSLFVRCLWAFTQWERSRSPSQSSLALVHSWVLPLFVQTCLSGSWGHWAHPLQPSSYVIAINVCEGVTDLQYILPHLTKEFICKISSS